ncbi:peptide deformylase [bacterium]|nr:MAG: peptide deformylase [bacterium]
MPAEQNGVGQSLLTSLETFAWSVRETPLRYLGDPVLREKCTKVAADEFKTSSIKHLAIELVKVLMDYRQNVGVGRGLAANQIGATKQMIAVLLGDEPEVFCNPRLIASKGMGSYGESCLSSGVMLLGEVRRPWTGKFEYENLDGVTKTLDADELKTRVILHEIDHLNGISCSDKYEPKTMRIVTGGKAEVFGERFKKLD